MHMANDQARGVVLMGVAGSGKTAVGMRLAQKLNWLFLDADNFHPAANIEKMRHGIALNDQDRVPWLERLRDELRRQIKSGHSVILACSALKESYRKILRDEPLPPQFVYLDVDAETIRERLSHRAAHFFPKELMDSQFATLAKPKDAIVVDARKPIDTVVEDIVHAIAEK
jgi:gluconokinase